jgi:glycosyltransferase involved in cell wall biosynthesis
LSDTDLGGISEVSIERELVSVIIPCYNQGKYLGEAIESILAQSYRHFEIIVIDDGSGDETSEVAARYEEVKCVRQENRGLSGARNRGIEESRGELVVFVDADDRLKREGLEAGVKAMREHPDCALVFGHSQFIASDGSPLATQRNGFIEYDYYLALLQYNCINLPAAAMYRRSLFDTVKGFNSSIDATEDYDMYLRIAREHKIVCHHELIAEYRQHGDQMSGDPVLMLKSVMATLNSQKEFVKGKREYEQALRKGLKVWRRGYGYEIAKRFFIYAAQGKVLTSLRYLPPLLRYYPLGLLAFPLFNLYRLFFTVESISNPQECSCFSSDDAAKSS